MKVGDRVRIVARSHPHHGSSGEIVEERRVMDLDFVVELDHGDYPGHRCFVSRDDVDFERRER